MKKRKPMPEMKEGGVNVTPLIDVVMCLIIFFMLVAKIGVSSGDDNSIAIPSLFYGLDIHANGNMFTLNVTRALGRSAPRVQALGADGVIHDLPLYDDKGATPLRSTLLFYRNGDSARGIAANPDFKVVIRGEQALPFSDLAPVLVECAKANCKSYAFAGTRGERSDETSPAMLPAPSPTTPNSPNH